MKEKLSLAVEDLKTSWYFRIYAATWLFLALWVFIALIVLGNKSSEAGSEQGFVTWPQSENQINFPDFNFRLATDEATQYQILSVVCKYNSTDVTAPTPNAVVETCKGTETAKPWCQTVKASAYTATKKHNEYVFCQVKTNAAPGPPTPDRVLGFEIFNDAEYGAAFTWMHPSDNAWILLTKTELKFEGGSAHERWKRDLVYHSTTAADEDSYNVIIKMNDFHVIHYSQQNQYNRWMSVADIGGFAFFLYILHVAFMALVGLVVANDSKFLGGDVQNRGAYSNL
jgi:hypothetical protein